MISKDGWFDYLLNKSCKNKTMPMQRSKKLTSWTTRKENKFCRKLLSVFTNNTVLEESSNSLMIDVCREENGSPGKVFFPLFFADFIIMGYSRKIPNTKAESIELFVCQGNNLWGRIFKK